MASLVTCNFCSTTRLAVVRSTTATGSSRKQQVRSTTTVARNSSSHHSIYHQAYNKSSTDSTSALLPSQEQALLPPLSTAACFSSTSSNATPGVMSFASKKNRIVPAKTPLPSSSSSRLLSSQATSAISLLVGSNNYIGDQTTSGGSGKTWSSYELLASALFAVTATACTMLYKSAPSISKINSNTDSSAASNSNGASFATVAALSSSTNDTNNLHSSPLATTAAKATATLASPSLHAPHILIGPSSRRGGSGGGDGGGGGPPGSGGGGPKAFSKVNTNTDVTSNDEPLKKNGVTTKNRIPKSYDISIGAVQGHREYMEDEYYISDGGRFVGVFDGHGGSGVSTYLRENLYKLVKEQLIIKHKEETGEILSTANLEATKSDSKIVPKMKNRRRFSSYNQGLATAAAEAAASKPSIASYAGAIRSSFEILDNAVLNDDRLQNIGSTAVAVVIHEGDDGHRTLLSANVGDSRAILCRRGHAVDLTRDHKPNDDREKARILAMGEIIEWDYYSSVHRVRNLSLSRAIGDRFAKPAVSGEVEIKHFPVAEDGDEFILLASDGVWDVMSSQEVVDFVQEKMNDTAMPSNPSFSEEDRSRYKYTRRKNMSRYVANEALHRGSGDNICVVMVWLQDLKFKPYK